jgi:hypothetical protein
MPRKQKRKDKKGKTTVSQQVNVYVTKRQSTKRGPAQPSQAQQLLQTLPLLMRQAVPTPQPLLQSAQLLQLLANLKGEKGEPGPPGPQGPSGYIPPINIPSYVGTPVLSESSGASLPSFAFDFDTASIGSSGKSYVADQPDEPLVKAAEPAISGGPQRLDPPHEDVPLESIEPYLSVYEIPPIDSVTRAYLNDLPNTTYQKTDKITLRMLQQSYGIQLSKGEMKNKPSMVDALWRQIQERQKNPSMSASAPK